MSINFKFLKTASVDANAATSTVALELDAVRNVFLSVEDVSGTHATHIVTLQMSADGTTWHNSTLTVTGLGFVEGTINARFVRATVTTLEGGAGVVDLIINAK